VAGEKRERTRRRLVEAAFKVVAERGFHAASVDLIARQAGLSTGALYANFRSKDDLLFSAFEEHLRWFGESLEATVTAPDLGVAVGAWIRALGEEREQFLVFVEFWAYALRREELQARLAGHMEAMTAGMADAIERRARADGTTPQLPPQLAAQLGLALARGLAFELVAAPGRVDVETIANLLAALVSADAPA
jgi:AcrR family transcriptional regulator